MTERGPVNGCGEEFEDANAAFAFLVFALGTGTITVTHPTPSAFHNRSILRTGVSVPEGKPPIRFVAVDGRSRLYWVAQFGGVVSKEDTVTRSFTVFFVEAEPRLRRALGVALGGEEGREAAAEALAWGWEHWDELQEKANPVGYLYRVGQSRARRLRRQPPSLPLVRPAREPWVEPGLPRALSKLSDKQRVVVMLVCSFDWKQTEVADLLGVSLETIHTHLKRGLTRLRSELGVGQ